MTIDAQPDTNPYQTMLLSKRVQSDPALANIHEEIAAACFKTTGDPDCGISRAAGLITELAKTHFSPLPPEQALQAKTNARDAFITELTGLGISQLRSHGIYDEVLARIYHIQQDQLSATAARSLP